MEKQHCSYRRLLASLLVAAGLADGAVLTDAEDVFRSRVHTDDQQVVVEQDDPRAQRVEDGAGVILNGAVVTRAGAALLRGTI